MSRKQRLHEVLFAELAPNTLIIEDESRRHHVPADGESHFKIIAVSARFESLSRINRHRLVNAWFANEFSSGLHALSLHLYTPVEWQQKSGMPPSSPACRNGKHHD
ncbi:BolA family protein [Legionella oakridgensis]|uniref:Stress-induced morphogen n=2 Tax=Legionella oakridgensis TaxID=29423 RepID=W0BCX6_9GAMM|nr:BolA family protein [Legionella oakridgensis]AHE66482.1 stress-induced morphogen [Legionella oakridgensis ATCC 33761 = DSM 21215]KTD43948.1 stress-induced morphogen [Legionella oakridgensis]STY19647.1 putative regulator of murein genes BolA [Legionella longbeachae]